MASFFDNLFISSDSCNKELSKEREQVLRRIKTARDGINAENTKVYRLKLINALSYLPGMVERSNDIFVEAIMINYNKFYGLSIDNITSFFENEFKALYPTTYGKIKHENNTSTT